MTSTSKKPLLWVCAAYLAACGPQAQPPLAQPQAAPHTTAAPDEKPRVELIPRSVLFGNPDRTLPQLSPDGKQIAWLAPKAGVLNVWVAPIDQVASARVITDDKVRGIRSYHWAQSSEYVLYAQDKGGDENWRTYSVELASGKVENLTPEEGVQARLFHMSPKKPNEVLIGLNARDKRFHDVFSVDLKSGKRTQIQKNDGYSSFVFDEQLAVRFGVKPAPDGGSAVFKKHGKNWLPFATFSPEDEMVSGPRALSADGKHLYFVDSRGRDRAALTRVAVATGKSEVLAEDLKADVTDLLLHPTEKVAQAAVSMHTRKTFTVIDPELKTDFETLLKAQPGELSVIDRSLDDRRWLVAYALDTGPTRYHLYNRVERKLTPLFADRPELERYPLAPMQPVVIPARDGMQLVSYITFPKESGAGPEAKPKKPYPMVLKVHGGPWSRDRWEMNAFHQWFANRGYIALSVNFRGSVGFGKAFVNSADGQWAATMHDDLIDAVRWAVDRKAADPKRVAIFGGSYGGYATLVGLTKTPDTFACGVDIVGPSNLVTLLESIPPYWESYKAMFKKRVGDISTDAGKALLVERSPLTHASKIQRPLLIGQGANDPRVKQAESDQIVAAMKKNAIPVSYVVYPDEGHGFARPENRVSFNAISEAFLAGCLGGRSEPFGNALSGSSLEIRAGREHIPGLPASAAP
jgi:dipeptidyl aminopeptidase/acylaminoacyl peptidase